MQTTRLVLVNPARPSCNSSTAVPAVSCAAGRSTTHLDVAPAAAILKGQDEVGLWCLARQHHLGAHVLAGRLDDASVRTPRRQAWRVEVCAVWQARHRCCVQVCH
jgi:hypothetical protein